MRNKNSPSRPEGEFFGKIQLWKSALTGRTGTRAPRRDNDLWIGIEQRTYYKGEDYELSPSRSHGHCLARYTVKKKGVYTAQRGL